MPRPKAARESKKATPGKSAAMATSPAISTTDEGRGPIFFWREYGHNYGFLSQWYESPFHAEDKDVIYQTAEQYMMYQKALLFSDPETGAKILQSTSAWEQKPLGRQVQNFDNKIWLRNRDRIVGDGSYFKFVNSLKMDEDLTSMLMETGDRELVEASPMDRIWGVGFGEKNAESRRARWGLNLLGKALMRARDRIREDGKKME